MSKVAQLYGMSVNEAMKLSTSQVQFMLEHAQTTAQGLLANNAAFKQALGVKLAPVTRAVRDQIGAADTPGDTTPNIDF